MRASGYSARLEGDTLVLGQLPEDRLP